MARAIEVPGWATGTIRHEGREDSGAPAKAPAYHAWAIALGMAGVIALALFFRLYRLDTFMHWAFGDEMTYSLEGQRVTRGEYTNLFAFTWDQAPATYAYLLSAAQRLFGVTLHTGRIVSVIFGAATVPLVALCARELKLSWVGSLLASSLLAVSHWHAHFSRMVVSTVPSAFALLLGLYCLMVAYRTKRWWAALLAGAVCGFAPYMFISNRIIAVILIAWLGYLAVFHRVWLRGSWPTVALFTGAFTLVLLPLALFWLRSPDWFVAPEHRVGLIYHIDDWRQQHPGESGSTWNILAHQLALAAGMFAIYGGPYVPWGGSYAPAMDPVTGWLLVPAIAYALYHWRRPLIALVLIWFACIWFFGVVLTIDAPQMEHAVGLIATAFLLIALLCDDLGAAIIRRIGHPVLYAGLAALLLLVSGLLNYNVFFNVWGGQLAGSGGFAWQWYDAGAYVARQRTPAGTAIYAAGGYPDEFFRFLSPHAGEFSAEGQTFRPASLYIVMADSPLRADTIAAHLPGARQERVYDADGDLAFIALIPHAPAVYAARATRRPLFGVCAIGCDAPTDWKRAMVIHGNGDGGNVSRGHVSKQATESKE